MSQNIEIQEAIEAGNKAYDALKKVEDTLDYASTVGTFDIMGGGFLASFTKREFILSARSQMEYANQCLDAFRRELHDVNAFDNVHIDLSTTFLAIDMFFDNFLADLAVQKRINDAQSRVEDAMEAVSQALDTLSDMMVEEAVKIPETRSFEPETHYATAEVYRVNNAIMRKAYPATDTYVTSLAAALAKGHQLYEEDVLIARDIVSREMNMFSGFRKDLAPIVTMFATQANFALPFINNIFSAKTALMRNLPGGIMVHLASIIMALYAEKDDYNELAVRAGVLYKRLKSRYMFLTNDNDTATCLIMAFSYKTDDELISDMGYIYPRMAETCKDWDAAQSAAAILSLFDTDLNVRIHFTETLYNSLKYHGYNVIPKYHLPLIAAAANSEDKDIMFDRICAIMEDLDRTQIITNRISPSKLLSIALGLAIREHPDIVAFDAIFMTYPLWVKPESNKD